jgi:hypothetical protein
MTARLPVKFFRIKRCRFGASEFILTLKNNLVMTKKQKSAETPIPIAVEQVALLLLPKKDGNISYKLKSFETGMQVSCGIYSEGRNGKWTSGNCSKMLTGYCG